MSETKPVIRFELNGVHVDAPTGFCWTTLALGPFSALLRHDIKWFAIMLATHILLVALSSVIDTPSGRNLSLYLISWVWFAYIYNQQFHKDLRAKGFAPVDASGQEAVAA